jgi:hypothetical protein
MIQQCPLHRCERLKTNLVLIFRQAMGACCAEPQETHIHAYIHTYIHIHTYVHTYIIRDKMLTLLMSQTHRQAFKH